FDYDPSGYPDTPKRELGDMTRGDPRPRPWYQSAKRANRQIWTPSYLVLGADGVPEQPGNTFSATVGSHKTGSLLGVMTIDFELTALSDFVRKLRLLDRGYLFIIESPPGEQPRILAHPNPSAIPETYPGAGAVPVVAGDNNSDGGASETPYYK